MAAIPTGRDQVRDWLRGHALGVTLFEAGTLAQTRSGAAVGPDIPPRGQAAAGVPRSRPQRDAGASVISLSRAAAARSQER